MKKADLIVDMQYGSTGKGLIAGYLAMCNGYDVVINANMPNAGHTFIDSRGNKMIHKVLPNGVVSPKCTHVLLGPGSVFDWSQLIKEWNNLHKIGYDQFKVYIHQNAVPLRDNHRSEEQKHLRIGSTAQGSAAATMHKMNRNPKDNPTAKNSLKNVSMPAGITVVDHYEYDNIVKYGKKILIEGAQGFSLGINERFYPYCTSRDCTPARVMSEVSVPLSELNEIIGCARTYPIRVGSPSNGYSGGFYYDQEEISWGHLGLAPEKTTVTKRVRRVFTFSREQIKDAMWHISPDKVFLNFCNYVSDPKELGYMVSCFEGKVKYMGYGPTVSDVFDLDDYKIKHAVHSVHDQINAVKILANKKSMA